MLLQPFEEIVALPPVQSDAQTGFSIAIFFTAERPWLVRKCAILTRNADAAEDLAQETLLEAWRHRDKVYDRENEQREERRRWLGAIAHNVCLRWLREDNHERAHRILPLPGGAGDTSSNGEEQDESSLELLATPDHYGVELEFERTELSALVNEALAYLSEPLRTALVARYIHGATHDEITQQLQVNEATLVQRIYRGKRALRTVLTTQLRDELAAYGIYQPGTATTGPLVTRMWCPWCGNGHLSLHDNGSSDGLLFTCQSCNRPAGGKKTIGNWPKVSSAAARYAQLLHWLHDYYWQAIDQTPTCIFCGASAALTTHEAHELPPRYRGLGDQPGIAITCTQCQRTHYNTLSHLTFDLPQVQRFWKTHKRIHWQPGEIHEHAGIPAWVSTFQSTSGHEQIEIFIERPTFRVLAINEQS
ncbi:hypothetical protein KDH_10930 [Dictyobacter sp. S3.2.2.5]|uniref:RNA polymerase sigma factor n=1 Tax=Dictyobacter halimunensis TaxID=3026934 RepID=A0ABQ6FJ81_9CHLR|nr:hypothetical protein KDH_10930 [Dictyobacter sp. S3.2.2.5]